MTDLVVTGMSQSDSAGRLETDDLGWPLAPRRIEELFEEVRTSR